MTALAKVAKSSRHSERIETLRERGYSEQEIAETVRLDRHNLWLVVVTIFALMVAAGLYSWQMFGPPSRSGEDAGIAAGDDEGGTGYGMGTVADFFRPKPVETAQESEDAEADAPKAGTASRSRKPAEATSTPELTFTVGPPLKATPAAIPYAGPDRDAVRRTTLRALKNGETRIWKHRGERGYVLVSRATDYFDRRCRQVSYTLIPETGDQLTSAPLQWCQKKGGKWVVDPYVGS
ncbi:hypothetical protein [Qipengyuania qiaonensis]|uniref:SH3 domain-containing protein n=1 Tax=Qipengyuania qiaonensis TaxID=2867240 RepID=A0ABS7J963_9SPHN|nr:hypothetical protein [Qipengyuania qiaonensis]MBX7483786.1 hypothetical protein [Qipengyuania qiaonensis]